MAKNLTFKLIGTTCFGCVSNIKKIFQEKGVEFLDINVDSDLSQINFRLEDDANTDFKTISDSLAGTKFKLEIIKPDNFFIQYFGIFTIFTISILANFYLWKFYHHEFQAFMAFWMILFGFTKIINLDGFSKLFQKYDLITKFIPFYSYIFVFLELGIGILMLDRKFNHNINYLSIFIFTVSTISVLRVILKKEAIKCGCLGAGGKMQVGFVTLFENLLMLLLSVKLILNI